MDTNDFYCYRNSLSSWRLFKAGTKTFFSTLAQEVNLEQVPISGQRAFNAQIHLFYKDGKLDTVTLVPKTTLMVEADHASETKK